MSDDTVVAGTPGAEALAAADALISDFGNHRRDAYFSRFAPEATFLFHSTPARLESRAAYEQLWHEWERQNHFRVISCVSAERRIQVFGEVAVFSHDVASTVSFDGSVETLAERESIVLENRGGEWLAVHEHLSART
ncbi:MULTISPECIES: nuclear transport factor 2 family protein [unclassified Cryobacterium]|uniref:nuclear transport factor 2 family protein n=1 Tax=unclassified Cryobacterium TaxID=2649013 RepID=UPI002AB37214|nr:MULTISPECIES: nuclear transport factor 2 family protein [unclassified Cryobacterium]MDY7541742.1 nuclear transport factor 2 family protein [Cryobacterium sp. 5B3]MEB0000199.1 nuclear transport factor 2 family protein [Cryobacterium sp. RTS3]MEB0266671.1 nuclear transport factor 2 family protein [Cryobacterium sp. 10I5]MEB0275854.1 nuclear transport factor 2 family protein [Cryobacterium sp. 5B3]